MKPKELDAWYKDNAHRMFKLGRMSWMITRRGPTSIELSNPCPIRSGYTTLDAYGRDYQYPNWDPIVHDNVRRYLQGRRCIYEARHTVSFLVVLVALISFAVLAHVKFDGQTCLRQIPVFDTLESSQWVNFTMAYTNTSRVVCDTCRDQQTFQLTIWCLTCPDLSNGDVCEQPCGYNTRGRECTIDATKTTTRDCNCKNKIFVVPSIVPRGTKDIVLSSRVTGLHRSLSLEISCRDESCTDNAIAMLNFTGTRDVFLYYSFVSLKGWREVWTSVERDPDCKESTIRLAGILCIPTAVLISLFEVVIAIGACSKETYWATKKQVIFNLNDFLADSLNKSPNGFPPVLSTLIAGFVAEDGYWVTADV